MKNEEKITELCKYYEMNCDWFMEALGQMAEWKKEQMIDKACEWWENKLTYPTMSQVEIDWMQTKIVAFRKAMEETRI